MNVLFYLFLFFLTRLIIFFSMLLRRVDSSIKLASLKEETSPSEAESLNFTDKDVDGGAANVSVVAELIDRHREHDVCLCRL
jgi:hypothetical protein